MPRPQKPRKVALPPVFTVFKPAGIGRAFLEQIVLSIDEYEALRLADYEGLSHDEAAEKMGISRPTFTRLLENARRKMAQMLVEGKQLVIEGGNVLFSYRILRCKKCGFIFKSEIEQPVTSCIRCGSTNIEAVSNPSELRGFGKRLRHRYRGGRNY